MKLAASVARHCITRHRLVTQKRLPITAVSQLLREDGDMQAANNKYAGSARGLCRAVLSARLSRACRGGCTEQSGAVITTASKQGAKDVRADKLCGARQGGDFSYSGCHGECVGWLLPVSISLTEAHART